MPKVRNTLDFSSITLLQDMVDHSVYNLDNIVVVIGGEEVPQVATFILSMYDVVRSCPYIRGTTL